MVDPLARVEVTKLARELGCEEAEVAFLSDRPSSDLRRLRTTITRARFARHEAQFRRLAGFTGMVPPSLAAKAAQAALGPLLSARVAAVVDPDQAVDLARRLEPGFLADVSLHLDPFAVAPIIGRLPDSLIVTVGRELLARGEHLVLGRFVSVVTTESSLAVVEDASAEDLLQIALFTEDQSALDDVVAGLPLDRLAGVVRHAVDHDRGDDALALLAGLSGSRERLLAAVDTVEMPEDVRATMVAARR